MSATVFIERKQAGRCNGATSPKAAVSGRDPHLPRRSTESRTRNLREACLLPIDPSSTDPPAAPRVKHAGIAQRCAVSSAGTIPSLCRTPMRRRLLCTRLEVRAGVRSDRGPATRLLEGRRVSGSAGIHEQPAIPGMDLEGRSAPTEVLTPMHIAVQPWGSPERKRQRLT